jgi:hypothetical protein
LNTDYFPNLTSGNHSVTSPETVEYNCIAWAAGDTEAWWWPDASRMYYWPPDIEPQDTLEGFERAFETLGYRRCSDLQLEPGYEKIVIYVGSTGKPTHAARQLGTGKWTSKLGRMQDIQHDTPEGVCGEAYGEIALVMRRPRDP